MMKTLPILIAIPLVVVYGICEGNWTNRWGQSKELEAAVARLKTVPLNAGEWQGKELELKGPNIQDFGMTSYLFRQYVNTRKNESLQVLIICGPPGPTCVHTPDVCYGGAGYVMAAAAVQHQEKVKGLPESPEMWTAEFRKIQSPYPDQLRIYWTWSGNGIWQAPSFARWHFAGQPFLYKVYIVRGTLEPGEPTRDQICMDFLQEFLPQLNQTLFPAHRSKN